MRIDPLKQYAKLRQQLLEEKGSLEARLQEINQVLQTETPELERTSSVPSATPARAGRRGRAENRMSLREAITKALARGPLNRHELADAVKVLGYVSNAKDPLNSMGVVLYAKNSPFKKKEGRFYLPGGAASQMTDHNGQVAATGKRTMSAEAKARISAAQKARWARQRRAAKAGK